MIKNLQNQIVKGIFTKEEMELIYDHINSTPLENIKIHKDLGHKMFLWGMPDSIQKKVLDVAQRYSEVPLKLTEISAVRYASGYGIEPNLYPHIDFFETPRFTLDIQLKSTRNWTIQVEEKRFTLRDNEALIFSGTNQVHWRDKTTFGHDDIVDMLFCHFSEDSDNPELNSEEFKNELLEKEKGLNELYEQNLLEDFYKIPESQ